MLCCRSNLSSFRLLPHIEGRYGTDATRDGRMLSGFSMGGNMAFYYAVKHPELFGAVTSYAGTFHHLYNKEYRTVGVPPEKAGELFDEMMREKWYLEENNILSLVRQNVEKIRGKLSIDLHIGTADILFCDNVIMHLYLESLNIPMRTGRLRESSTNQRKSIGIKISRAPPCSTPAEWSRVAGSVHDERPFV